MSRDNFMRWIEQNRNANTARQRDEMHVELMRIAALDEGDVVDGSFEEPASARIARAVLAKEWIGPCLHGRDPWDRCDDCGEMHTDVAWAKALRAEMLLGCQHHETVATSTGALECKGCGFLRSVHEWPKRRA
jgi:hypothetical protein